MQNTIEALPGKGTEPEKKLVRKLFEYLNHDESCERLLRQMEEANIDKSALLVIDWGLTYKDFEYPIEEVMAFHRKVLETHPDKFWVFAGIDPRRGQQGLDLFEKSVKDWGFHGLKLYPPCGFSPSDEQLFPFYEICEQYGIPVLTHVGPSSPSLRTSFAMPIEIDTAAWKFPKVNFILGHGAFTHAYDCGLLAAHRNNIYLDMSGFQTQTDQKFEETMIQHLKLRLHKKILFGTDWPVHFFSGHQRNALKKMEMLLTHGVLDQTNYDLIMYKNFERLMS